ncbi:MAG TPA: hypothetical protein VH063_11940, partial [Gaiellaceae bacterium]|nr:hypothetical protein [Gaiellaceae bacterium]
MSRGDAAADARMRFAHRALGALSNVAIVSLAVAGVYLMVAPGSSAAVHTSGTASVRFATVAANPSGPPADKTSSSVTATPTALLAGTPAQPATVTVTVTLRNAA